MKKSLSIFAIFLSAGVLCFCAPESVEDPFRGNGELPPSYSSSWRSSGLYSSSGGSPSRSSSSLQSDPDGPRPPEPTPSYVNCMIWESCYENITRDYCSQNGGAIVNSCRPTPPTSMSSSSVIPSSPSSSSSEADSEDCGYWCRWPAGCYKITPDMGGQYTCAAAIESCLMNASMHSNSTCTAFVGGRDPNRVILGCCRWPEDSLCWNIYSDQTDDITGCRDYGWGDWWNGACPNDYGGCPN